MKDYKAELTMDLVNAIKSHQNLKITDDEIIKVGIVGADSGLRGFMYFGEISEFYAKHEDILWRFVREETAAWGFKNPLQYLAQLDGADTASDANNFRTLIVWKSLEGVGQILNAKIAEIKMETTEKFLDFFKQYCSQSELDRERNESGTEWTGEYAKNYVCRFLYRNGIKIEDMNVPHAEERIDWDSVAKLWEFNFERPFKKDEKND